jgi:DNA-binding NarL/FixJ family response regulator
LFRLTESPIALGGISMNPIRLLIVDDHVVVRKGIQMMLGTEPSIQVVGEAENSQDAICKAKSLRPDVILMDLVMPQGDGLQATAEIKRAIPTTRIIILTMFHDEAKIDAAIEAGADGYLLKDADGEELIRAIHAVQQGGMPFDPQVVRHLVTQIAKSKDASESSHLTRREKEVLRLVAKGMSTKAVARALNVEEGTARIHIHNILLKLGVSSRAGAASWAVQMGLLTPDDEET